MGHIKFKLKQLLDSLANSLTKINQPRFILPIIYILGLTLAFGLGRVGYLWPSSQPIKFEFDLPPTTPIANDSPAQTKNNPSPSQPSGQLVGSKNGTKYHLPSCPGAKQIKEANKIFFASIEEATRAGYTPAANCPGLK